MTGSLVSPATRQRVRDAAVPIARAMGRVGLTPNALTVIGFLGTCLAAVAASQQAWLAAGVLVLAFGVFDLFDGALARATNRVSRFGAFLDSSLDRSGELVVYLGLLWGTLDLGLWLPDILVAWAMAASTMVSYTRAKAESLGFTPGTGMAAVGLAPREVRLAILSVGLIVAGLLPGVPEDTSGGAGGAAYPLSGMALDLTFGLIAILATITTIQRILVVRTQAKEG
ncbi:MAG TPA: CDP-alcohol phosphatidyltransferase family protein [Candidatus Limnocylindrales bacterium]